MAISPAEFSAQLSVLAASIWNSVWPTIPRREVGRDGKTRFTETRVMTALDPMEVLRELCSQVATAFNGAAGLPVPYRQETRILLDKVKEHLDAMFIIQDTWKTAGPTSSLAEWKPDWHAIVQDHIWKAVDEFHVPLINLARELRVWVETESKTTPRSTTNGEQQTGKTKTTIEQAVVNLMAWNVDDPTTPQQSIRSLAERMRTKDKTCADSTVRGAFFRLHWMVEKTVKDSGKKRRRIKNGAALAGIASKTVTEPSDEMTIEQAEQKILKITMPEDHRDAILKTLADESIEPARCLEIAREVAKSARDQLAGARAPKHRKTN